MARALGRKLPTEYLVVQVTRTVKELTPFLQGNNNTPPIQVGDKTFEYFGPYGTRNAANGQATMHTSSNQYYDYKGEVLSGSIDYIGRLHLTEDELRERTIKEVLDTLKSYPRDKASNEAWATQLRIDLLGKSV